MRIKLLRLKKFFKLVPEGKSVRLSNEQVMFIIKRLEVLEQYFIFKGISNEKIKQ